MTNPGGQSILINKPVFWLDIWSGRTWYEKRFHRGHVVLGLMGGPPCHEMRIYRPEDNPGTTPHSLGAPNWIRTCKPWTKTK